MMKYVKAHGILSINELRVVSPPQTKIKVLLTFLSGYLLMGSLTPFIDCSYATCVFGYSSDLIRLRYGIYIGYALL